MRCFISFKIGDEPTEDGRIENGHLVVRLPADFPPDFRGQIKVELPDDIDECVDNNTDTFCSTGPVRDWPPETADGMDNDCDGTNRHAAPPA